MDRNGLLEALSSRALLCDGAMGTQLMAAGLTPGQCGELWNAQRSEAVEAIHRRYVDAGCDLITTNTFGGTASSLGNHGLAERAAELNLRGAEAARRAAGDRAWVLGDIGPCGQILEPYGDAMPDAVLELFRAQAVALRQGGADAAIVETMGDPTEMALAIRAAKAAGPWPVIATYAFAKAGNEFRTMMGTSAADALKAAVDAGADVVGANCGTSLSLDDYQRLADALVAAAGSTPAILQPNAGSPQSVGGRLVYGALPADMARLAPRLLASGLRVLGGCCGTTPDHLAAMKKAMEGKPAKA